MQPNNPQRPNPAGQRPQFFDVVRPGRTPASPTSRPMLPNNRPAVHDTSMKLGVPAVPPSLMSQPSAPAPQPVASVAARPAPVSPTPTPAPVVAQPAARPLRPNQPMISQRFGQSPAAMQPAQPIAEQSSSSAIAQQPQPAAHQQKHSIWSEVLAVLAIVLLVAIIINILLDAEIINLPIPHTNFFEY